MKTPLYKKVAARFYIATNDDDTFDEPCKRGGTCYQDAARYILREGSQGSLLVHGRPTLQVPPYIEYGHAWIEEGNQVIDPSSGFKGPKAVYYALGNIDERNNLVYTQDEVRDFLIAYGHYGPWEGPEGVGPDPQAKQDWLKSHKSLPKRSNK